MAIENANLISSQPDYLSQGYDRKISYKIPYRRFSAFIPGRFADSIIEGIKHFNQMVSTTLEQDLLEKGLIGEHELLDLTLTRGMWADLKGSFRSDSSYFLVIGNTSSEGSIEGSLRSGSAIQFAWHPKKDEVVISEIPFEKLVVEENETIKVPQIAFILNENEFIKHDDRSDFSILRRTVSYFDHPNDYLQGARLSRAVLKVNSINLLLPTKSAQ